MVAVEEIRGRLRGFSWLALVAMRAARDRAVARLAELEARGRARSGLIKAKRAARAIPH